MTEIIDILTIGVALLLPLSPLFLLLSLKQKWASRVHAAYRIFVVSVLVVCVLLCLVMHYIAGYTELPGGTGSRQQCLYSAAAVAMFSVRCFVAFLLLGSIPLSVVNAIYLVRDLRSRILRSAVVKLVTLLLWCAVLFASFNGWEPTS